MILLLSLAIVGLFVGFGSRWLKAHAKAAYWAAAALALLAVALVWTGAELSAPDWLRLYGLPLLTHGGLATALFMVVMFTGTLKNGSRGMKKLMPVRGELSILASILTLGHNVAYGKTYFVALFAARPMAINVRLAAVCSLLMLIIMLPLFVTSFPGVRCRMHPKRWKRLQRFAYGFYGLMGVHVLLLYVPSARMGSVSAIVNVCLYSLVFLGYAVLRVRKALLKRQAQASLRRVPAVAAVVAYALILTAIAPGILPQEAPAETAEQAGDSEAAQERLEETDAADAGEADEPAQEAASTEGGYADGVYKGTGKGYNGKLTIEVTIEQGAISDMTLIDSLDDEPYITRAVKGITGQLLEAQSAELDGVSGATYSSRGLISAVEDALEDAAQ